MKTIEIPDPRIQPQKKSQVPNSNADEARARTEDATDEAEGPRTRRRTTTISSEVEPWPEAVDGLALLDALRDMVKRFVVVPAWAVETLALWILHTFAYELRDVSTYIGIESPERQCGKTTLLTVLSELVNRPVVSSNVSPPALFRAIEELRPTLLIDEADTFLKGNDEFRGILNAGYTRKTAFVLRVANQVRSAECGVRNVEEEENDTSPRLGKSSKLQNPSSRETPNLKTQIPDTSEENDTSPQPSPRGGEGVKEDRMLRNENTSPRPSPLGGEGEEARNGGSRLARFSCWCPKVMCSIGHLPDTLADRCIVIRMQRKRADEPCERLRNLETKVLKQQCARFVLDYAEAIAAARPEMPASLNDRASDIWEPLLTLADLAGGHWPDTARKAAVSLSTTAQQSNPIGSLMLDMFILFAEEKVERMFTRKLIDGLMRFSDRPWQEMAGVRQTTARQGNGKEITGPWLSRLLRPYGIRPRTVWIGESSAKGYVLDEMIEILRRYVSRSDLEALKAEWAEEDRARAQKAEMPDGENVT